MKLIETKLRDAVILEPDVYKDERGYFMESYNFNKYKDQGVAVEFVQDNESFSSKGVLRGLHYQCGEHAQSKLVRVIKGEVKDIIVDIREGSPTYGESVEVILSESNFTQLFVPRGFAHGFIVLSDQALFSYKCDNFYNKESEGQINPLCPKLNLNWGIEQDGLILSDKDVNGPNIGEHKASGIRF